MKAAQTREITDICCQHTKHLKMPRKTLLKEIIRVAFPLVVSTGCYTVLTFTDRMFLSWHSPQAIAASVPAAILSFTVICFFMGIGAYVSTLIAQFFGAKDYSNVARSLWQGLYFAAISTILIVLFIPLGEWCIDLSGHSPDVIPLEKTYFRILMAGGGLVVLIHVLESFFSGLGQTKPVMAISVLGAVVNIALNYLLIFGTFGFPELGIAGAGLATVISNILMCGVCVMLIFSSRNRERFGLTQAWQFHSKVFRKLIRFGAPHGFHIFVDILAFTLFFFLIGTYGNTMLAASNIAISVNMLSFMPMIGLGIANTVLVGQYIGKGRQDIAIGVTHICLVFAVVYGAVVGLLFWFIPMVFIRCFEGNDPVLFAQVVQSAIPLFKVLPFFLMADAFCIVFGSALSGAGDTRFKMIAISGLILVFFLPGEFLILGQWKYPIQLGWVWATVYLTILGLVFFSRFKRGKWKEIDMIS